MMIQQLFPFILFTSVTWATTKGSLEEDIDVIVIGAGSSGAAAAREFHKWNSNHGTDDEITYAVLEAGDRIGGRVLDIELGGIEYDTPQRTSGGFRKNPSPIQDPWENVGCHCDEPSCLQFNVEVGAGWFTGDDGVDLSQSCVASNTTHFSNESANKYRDLVSKSNPKQFASKKGLLPRDRNTGEKVNCDVCPLNYNRMYALSQGQANDGMGNLSPPLEVNCNSYDGQDDTYGLLDTTTFYGKNEYGVIEQKPLDDESRSFPGLTFQGNQIPVTARFFYEIFWVMKYQCIDYESYEFYNHWKYFDESDTPFLYAPYSMSWTEFDIGWDQMPDNVRWWNVPFYNQRRDFFCNSYKESIESFLDGTSEADLDAKKLYNFIKNFNYFSEFLDGQTMSFMNFGDGGTRTWGYGINYSIDQRGLKSVIEEIMPENSVLFNHRVTSVDWTGNSCTSSHPVQIEVDIYDDYGSIIPKTYCTKRVISTVSLGVLEDRSIDFTPLIDISDSPFKPRFGNLVKIYFRFPEKFWGDEEYITFLMEEDFRRDTTNNNIKGEYFYNLDQFFKNGGEPETNSLFMFMATHDVDLIGVNNPNVTDSEVSEKIWHILDPLRMKYGDDFMEPNCWYFKNWEDDTLFKGAYGIQKFGATYYDHKNFFAPRTNVDDEKVLYISGDSSCFSYWGFIEGAYEAGSRDARLVIRDIMNTTDVSSYSPCYLQREFEHCFEAPCA